MGFHEVREFQNLARKTQSEAQNGLGIVRTVANAQFANGDCEENKFKKVYGKSNFHKISFLPFS